MYNKVLTRLLIISWACTALTVSGASKAQNEENSRLNFPLAINYDTDFDKDNIWLLDLSNGERVAIRLMPAWAIIMWNV